MRVLGLDVGEKRVGVALGDPTGFLATPLTTIERRGSPADADEILRIATEHNVGEIVVGMPFTLSGHVGTQAKKVAWFTRLLAERTALPVRTVDERFSSVQAKRLLRASGIVPSRNKARVDSAAAAVILQSFLDSRRSGTANTATTT